MKTPKLKARRMWANYYSNGIACFPTKIHAWQDDDKSKTPVAQHTVIPVAVIPLDDVDSLLRKAGDAFAESHDGSLHSSDIVAMLTAIGVLPRTRKGGRK